MTDRQKNLSRLFVWGFEGTSLSPALRRALRRYPPAGVILFRRNIESPHQLRALTSALRKEVGARLLIGIDQEGGRVSRFPEPFTPFPAAETWGLISKLSGTGLLRGVGRLMGRELASVGINLDFAPVLDVNSNPKNPVIGDRAFSDDPAEVIRTAIPFAQGLRESGVIPCGKHFPGHGDTVSDSHLVLPRVNRPLASLKKVELPPFRAAVRAGIPMLMTAHVVYRALDRENPATLSHAIVTRLLRKKWGYRGVVISDDLQMKAIRFPLEEAVRLGIEAGIDLQLVCRGYEELSARIPQWAEKSAPFRPQIEASLARVERLKNYTN